MDPIRKAQQNAFAGVNLRPRMQETGASQAAQALQFGQHQNVQQPKTTTGLGGAERTAAGAAGIGAAAMQAGMNAFAGKTQPGTPAHALQNVQNTLADNHPGRKPPSTVRGLYIQG